MANARQKIKMLTRSQWNNVIDRYYNGDDPHVIANDIGSNVSLVFDHINKDKRARARRGLSARVRKNRGAEMDIINEEIIKSAVEESAVVSAIDTSLIEEVSTEIEKKRRGGKKLDIPDNFVEVYNAYSSKEDGYATLNDAAAKLNVSPATFSRWKIGYKEYLEKQSSSEETKVANEEPIIDMKDDRLATTLVFEDKPVLEVGMMADRHDMPVSKFIFPGAFNKEEMWDYKHQEDIVEKFILKEIGTRQNPITGKREAKKDLVVYATGIQCALCSIFKMCNKYGINLTVMHHDSAKDVYHPQSVIVGKRAGVEDMFKTNKLELLGCEFKDITSSDSYYSIKKIFYDTSGKTTRIEEIVSPYKNLIYDKCTDMIRDILLDRTSKYRICLNTASIKDNKERELERLLDTRN